MGKLGLQSDIEYAKISALRLREASQQKLLITYIFAEWCLMLGGLQRTRV